MQLNYQQEASEYSTKFLTYTSFRSENNRVTIFAHMWNNDEKVSSSILQHVLKLRSTVIQTHFNRYLHILNNTL